MSKQPIFLSNFELLIPCAVVIGLLVISNPSGLQARRGGGVTFLLRTIYTFCAPLGLLRPSLLQGSKPHMGKSNLG